MTDTLIGITQLGIGGILLGIAWWLIEVKLKIGLTQNECYVPFGYPRAGEDSGNGCD